MSNLNKEKITSDLNKIKEEGKLRRDRIKEILQSAVSQAISELKEGQSEVRSVVKDAVVTAVETFQEKGGELKDEVTASIEGAIAGLSSARRTTVAKTQAEVKQLQDRLDTEEEEMIVEIDSALQEIENTGKDRSEQVKEAIESAVNTIKDSEEVTLLQKRYAQLKAQLAVVQANLANRYGERYEDVKHYLDDAKVWYERAKADPEAFTEKVEDKRKTVEAKLEEAGGAIAKKESQMKQILRDLWQSMTEAFREKH
jgi:hypothetical protein